jgi:SNF2 family DNA or RNA helicase
MHDISAYHAKYFANLLTLQQSVEGTEWLSQSIFDAQIDLNPHQVEAALFAFRSPLSNGVLLADEVGLGKTIEAGLVLCQYWSERRRKLLIIAPASLRKQWSAELKEKFFLDSVIIDGKSFKEEQAKGNRNPFEQDNKIVSSSSENRSANAAVFKKRFSISRTISPKREMPLSISSRAL